eukprot:364794-Chlamydomonas_euryale.AAC.25
MMPRFRSTFAKSIATALHRAMTAGRRNPTSRLMELKNKQAVLKMLGYCLYAAAFIGSSPHGCA